jgi:hypothetical protein
MAARRSDPESLGVLLATSRDRTARLAGVGIDGESWRKVVGERIALRTEPGRLTRDGELTIHVASAAWAQELSLLSRDILQRLIDFGLAAKSLRFRVRQMEPQSARPAAPKPAAKTALLPDELKARLQEIGDPELRAAIAEAAALHLARPQAATSAPRAARAPRSAGPRSAPPDRSSAAKPGASARKRGAPRG